MKCSLGVTIFLRSLVFPLLSFSSICIVHLRRSQLLVMNFPGFCLSRIVFFCNFWTFFLVIEFLIHILFLSTIWKCHLADFSIIFGKIVDNLLSDALYFIFLSLLSTSFVIFFFFFFFFFFLLVTQSCQTFCNPWTVTHQTPPSMGFSRQEYWNG